MMCPNCGKENVDGVNFCMACGTRLNAETAQSRSYELGYEYTGQAYPQMQLATAGAGAMQMAYAGQGYVQPAYAGQAYAQPAYADQSYAVQENVQETIPQGMTYGKSANSGLAVASLVFGIVALLTSFIIVLGLINALLAVSFGIAGLVSCKKNQKSGKGLAIAGLIMGGIALIIAIVVIVKALALYKAAAGVASGAKQFFKGF